MNTRTQAFPLVRRKPAPSAPCPTTPTIAVHERTHVLQCSKRSLRDVRCAVIVDQGGVVTVVMTRRGGAL
jgi:microsomal dipeptidase-like Zn-dependent dipeptidase